MAQQPFLLHPPPISSQSHPPWGFLLVLSLFFNALCVVIIGKHSQLLNRGSDLENLQSLGWSKKAAEEAEAAAKYSCSGHGYVFLDTFRRNQDGNPLCECNECYRGLDCSEIDPDCVANADSGDPGFLEPFWIANSEAGTTVVPAWYRMSYLITDGSVALMSPELEKKIRAIHALVGNAVTEGRYIVLGTGSMQLINAAINSLSPAQTSNPAQVVAAVPYYSAYKGQTELFDSSDNLWNGDARAFKDRTKSLNSTTFIEFVTSPNNPDGLPKEGVLTGKNVKAVYDHAYYWPHFTAISHQANEDIMLFTLQTYRTCRQQARLYRNAGAAYESLSTKLGEQKFFLENKPTSVDAYFLGHALFVLQTLNDSSKLRQELMKHDNLIRYAENLKTEFLEASSSSAPPRSSPNFASSSRANRSHTSSGGAKHRGSKEKQRQPETEEQKTFKKRSKYFLITQFVAVVVFFSIMGGTGTGEDEAEMEEDGFFYED